MPDKAFSDYFYGDEATRFTYFRIPLSPTPGSSTCPTDSKPLYGMLLDRMSLSIKNEWYNDAIPLELMKSEQQKITKRLASMISE